MSSRALRRLHGSSLPELPVDSKVKECSGDESAPELAEERPAANRFGLLGSDDDIGNTGSDGDKDTTSTLASANVAAVSSSDKKTKSSKKNKHKKKQRKVEASSQNELDDVDSALKEINSTGMSPFTDVIQQPQGRTSSVSLKQHLTVQHRFLNPLNEIKKRFGSKVVQNKGARRAVGGVRCYRKPTHLSSPTDAWRKIGKTGISMVPTQFLSNCQYFVFEHSPDYQKVQAMFWEAVDTMNPDNIVAILNLHPYHIDSLLQLSDVCRMSEDLQMAADLIERSLYVFEMAFHPLFNLTTSSCRLDYRQWENRGFFVALFRQIRFTSGRGCYRTALELCKLLLGLDPDGDPLCVLLMIDCYALQSEEYGFLVELFDDWDPRRNLSKLPNFAYSVPLALYHLSCSKSDDGAPNDVGFLSRADRMLQSALMMFPGLLMPLLDKINVNPEFDATAGKLFGPDAQLRQPVALQQLISLYIDRCHPCWKTAGVVQWLEGNVTRLIKRSTDLTTLAEIERYARTRDSCFRGSTPVNVYRHIIMSEVKSVAVALPPEYSNTPIVSYDPLPPRDSIQSYERPERRRRVESQSALSAFFHSLLPNFNPQEPAAADAEAGAAGGPQNLREGIDALMNAMRHLLQNIQMAPPPREDDGGEEGDGDDLDDEQDWD